MQQLGLKSLLIAGLFAMAGPAALAAPAPAPSAVAAAPAADSAKPADPTLNADGSQKVAPVAHVGQPTDKWIQLQDEFSPNGREARWFHNTFLVPLMLGISVLVMVLLLVVMLRFNRRANPVPSKNSHNTILEIVWTAVPVLILVVVAIPSIRLLANQYKPAPDDALTIKAIGNQWFWEYEYPDNGIQLTANMLKECKDVGKGERCRTDTDGPRLLATDNRIVLPVGRPIRLITTARDVIHSWAVPAFWIKLDGVPGKLNETSFTIDKPGLYFGQCSELCGAYHGFMPIAVEAVSEPEFEAWVKSKGGTLKPVGAKAPAPAPAPSAAADAAVSNQSDAANLTADAEL